MSQTRGGSMHHHHGGGGHHPGGNPPQTGGGAGGAGGGGAGAGGLEMVLEEEYDPDYEPSSEEILEYAQFLGMDLDRDQDLFWIAREGLKAPLPEPWKPCKTEENDIYYFNFSNGDSVWEHPCDEYYRNLYQTEKKKKTAASLKPQSASTNKPNSSNSTAGGGGGGGGGGDTRNTNTSGPGGAAANNSRQNDASSKHKPAQTKHPLPAALPPPRTVGALNSLSNSGGLTTRSLAPGTSGNGGGGGGGADSPNHAVSSVDSMLLGGMTAGGVGLNKFKPLPLGALSLTKAADQQKSNALNDGSTTNRGGLSKGQTNTLAAPDKPAQQQERVPDRGSSGLPPAPGGVTNSPSNALAGSGGGGGSVTPTAAAVTTPSASGASAAAMAEAKQKLTADSDSELAALRASCEQKKTATEDELNRNYNAWKSDRIAYYDTERSKQEAVSNPSTPAMKDRSVAETDRACLLFVVCGVVWCAVASIEHRRFTEYVSSNGGQ